MNDKRLPPEVRDGLKARARKMRSASTEAEDVLWQAVRDRRLGGLKIRRQHRIGPFIVDFYIAKARLVIEIDGPIHAGQKRYDEEREHPLTVLGHRVIRFMNEEVSQNLDKVLKSIRETAAKRQ